MVGEKRKDKGKGTRTSTHKNKKSHRVLTSYTLTNDDIERINYQVRDAFEEAVEQASHKQDELHHKGHTHLTQL
jgi:hypothetical protein